MPLLKIPYRLPSLSLYTWLYIKHTVKQHKCSRNEEQIFSAHRDYLSSLCMLTHTHAHTLRHTHTHTHTHAHTHTHTHTHTHAHLQTHTHTHTHSKQITPLPSLSLTRLPSSPSGQTHAETRNARSLLFPSAPHSISLSLSLSLLPQPHTHTHT